jgi:hypothetical protein
MPTRRATSLMRNNRCPPVEPDKDSDACDKFFLLDTAPGFL